MPDKSPTTGSKMSSNKCSCCPYGFHIDRDFVRYCDSLYNSAQLDKLRQHKRERRKEKKSVESYLGLGSLSFEGNEKNQNLGVRRNSVTQPSKQSVREFCLQNDDLKNAVSDFEDTWKKSLKKSYSSHVIDGRNGIKQSDNHLHHSTDNSVSNVHHTPSRSSSMSSVSSQSTSLSYTGVNPIDDFCSSFVSGLNASLSSLSKPLNNMPQQTVGIDKSVLTNIREQMASSLHRMKELEEQVRAIPTLKGKLSALYEEKKSLLNELKLKESMLIKAECSKKENEFEKLLKKLENEGIMSPTLSRKCLSLRLHSDNLFSPAIASSLDATMIKKKFIEKEIISHLKMNDVHDCTDKNKNKKSIGTSCAVLTREIGVGYVPNKYKSVGVGNDFSLNENLNLFKKGHFEKQTSISSESLESDIDSLNGIVDIPQYHTKPLPLTAIPVGPNVLKSCVDASTNTNINYVDKCISTEKERAINYNKFSLEKFVKHKAISVAPSVSNKYIQVSSKCSVKNIGSQTTESSKQIVHQTQPSLRHIGIGDFFITDVLCDNCKKSKKSVGVGDSNVKSIFCDKCQFNTNSSIPPKHQNTGVGDFDINNILCEKCQFKKEPELSKSSVGINTSFDLSCSARDIHICDKCSATIHSVAQDLAADSKETTTSKPSSTDNKASISKHKLSKLKTDIQPLKIKTEKTWSSTVETTYQNETQNKKSVTRRTREIKEDDQIVIRDADITTEQSPSSEILPQFTDLPVLPKKKCDLSKEIKAACKVLNDHLQKSDRGGEKKMLSSLMIIQTEWFKVANQKKADPHLIEAYLDTFEEFSKLLLHKIVNLSDNNGNTALHYAVSYGNFDVVSILIDSKVCDVNIKNKAGYTSIMLVALADVRNDTHHYVVQRLFSIGDINMKASQNGQTALMLAVSHKKQDIVKILLDVGAEINLQDKDGSTALMCAAEHGHLDIAKILLSNPECDPTIVDNDGCNALTIAMEAGHKDIGLLIYANMNFSRGSSPYSTLKTRKRSTPRSTPPPNTPTLRTPPLPSPATKSLNSLTSFQFPN